MFLLSVRCSVSCLLIIALTGLLQIIHAESFRPIFNPNVALKPTAKKITAITTTTTTVRPLTTISATLKSRVSLTKQQTQPQHVANRAPVKALSSPSQSQAPHRTDNAATDTKDAPVAEALRGDWRRRWRRPYYPYAGNYLPSLASSRYRRRPNQNLNPKPYYAPPSYSNYYPYEDYRFETDFLGDQGSYIPKSKPKAPSHDANKDYGIVDTDIGAFYDSQSATYNVPPIKSYDPQASYFGTGSASTGLGKGTGSSLLSSNVGSGVGASYSDYGDADDYKYSTSKPKTSYKSLPSRSPVKQMKTRNKYAAIASYDEDYRYPSEISGAGSQEFDDSTTESNSAAKFNNIYLPQHTIYQTAPKQKPKPKPSKTTTTTYSPPIKISDTSIDVLTKPLGSATFNLNLSPGTVYNPGLNYNPSATNYNPPQTNYNPPSNNYKQIPLQPPATSYGVPIAPPLNSYTYQNSYQNEYGSYPPSLGQNNGNYLNPSQITITNAARSPGLFAEPPPLNQQTLANVDVSYNSVQSSYDATPKQTRPTKRKPTKVNSKRVSTKRPVLNTDEELADDEQNEQQNDNYGESYSFYKTMPQPSLPNAYDQEEFHTVKKGRKQSKQAVNYYERDEKQRTTKKPKQPIEVTLRIPDEDYLDDLVKVVQTTKRPKKKSKQSSSHVLDTEDLRDAYDSNAAYYPKKKKTRYQPSGDYDNYEDDNGEDDYENDRLSNVNSKENTKSSGDTEANADNSQEQSYWDKDSSIYKQYGIRARNDNFSVRSGFEVQGYNNGFRPIRKDQSIIYNEHPNPNPSNVRATYTHDIASVMESKYSNGNRISSTLRSVTSTIKPSTLFVWDGGELPKNHKLV